MARSATQLRAGCMWGCELTNRIHRTRPAGWDSCRVAWNNDGNDGSPPVWAGEQSAIHLLFPRDSLPHLPPVVDRRAVQRSVARPIDHAAATDADRDSTVKENRCSSRLKPSW